MGSRWAMLGSALGGGFSKGLNQQLEQQFKQKAATQSLEQQLNWYASLSPERRKLLAQMQGGGDGPDPLKLAIAAMLGYDPASIIQGTASDMQTQSQPQPNSSAVPMDMPGLNATQPANVRGANTGVGRIIANDTTPAFSAPQPPKTPFGVFEFEGNGYAPSSRAEMDALIKAGAVRIQ